VEGHAGQRPERLPPPRVGPVRGVEPGDAALQRDRQPDVGVAQAERPGDLLAQVLPVGPAVQAADEVGADPVLGQEVVGADRAGRVLERHRLDGGDRRRPLPPAVAQIFNVPELVDAPAESGTVAAVG